MLGSVRTSEVGATKWWVVSILTKGRHGTVAKRRRGIMNMKGQFSPDNTISFVS